MNCKHYMLIPVLAMAIGCVHGSPPSTPMGKPATQQPAALSAEGGPPEALRKKIVDLIEAREKVRIQYTCYDEQGAAAATDIAKSCDDPAIRKSRIFTPLEDDAGRVFIAGPPRDQFPQDDLLPFDEALRTTLAAKIVGVLNGQPMRVVLSAREQSKLSEEQRRIGLAIKRKLPKVLHLERRQFSLQTDAEPEVGAAVDLHRELDGRIAALTDSSVEIHFTPKPREILDNGPFGPVLVHDRGDFYEAEVVAKDGTLVKTGPYVGAIKGKERGMFFLDYGHPFGGQQLICDVVARRIETAADAAEPAVALAVEKSPPPASFPGDRTAAQGDLATLAYSAWLSDGSVLFTNEPDVFGDGTIVRSELFYASEPLGPEPVVVGKPATVPGVENAVAGMSVGQSREVVLKPQEAFGLPSPRLIKSLPLHRDIPKIQTYTPEDFISAFGFLPKENQIFDLNPYVAGRVVNVDGQGAKVAASPKKEKFTEPYGITSVTEKDDKINIGLDPKVGALFPLHGKTGKIISTDGDSFTIDFNTPLAGETIHVRMRLIGLTKADAFGKLSWLEDYDGGLKLAREENKPMILVLYASWCKWCKRLLTESMEDPRIKSHKDDFVWVKVDSDKDSAFKEMFEQKGYPLTLVLNSRGDVIERLDGFRDAAQLNRALGEVLGRDLHAERSVADVTEM